MGSVPNTVKVNMVTQLLVTTGIGENIANSILKLTEEVVTQVAKHLTTDTHLSNQQLKLLVLGLRLHQIWQM